MIGTLPGDDFDELKRKTQTFTAADFFDAYAIFEYLQQRELSRPLLAEIIRKFEKYSFFHRSRISVKGFHEEKANLKLVTIFDITNHGKSLIKSLF